MKLYLTIKNETRPLCDWCYKFKVPYHIAQYRYYMCAKNKIEITDENYKWLFKMSSPFKLKNMKGSQNISFKTRKHECSQCRYFYSKNKEIACCHCEEKCEFLPKSRLQKIVNGIILEIE